MAKDDFEVCMLHLFENNAGCILERQRRSAIGTVLVIFVRFFPGRCASRGRLILSAGARQIQYLSAGLQKKRPIYDSIEIQIPAPPGSP